MTNGPSRKTLYCLRVFMRGGRSEPCFFYLVSPYPVPRTRMLRITLAVAAVEQSHSFTSIPKPHQPITYALP
jgi:hypothetical protein